MLTRKFATVLGNDLLRSSLKISSAAVIAKACPQAEHLLSRSIREFLHCRKPPDESLEIRHSYRNTRLLQHDFRDPSGVSISQATPRQTSFALIKPDQ